MEYYTKLNCKYRKRNDAEAISVSKRNWDESWVVPNALKQAATEIQQSQ